MPTLEEILRPTQGSVDWDPSAQIKYDEADNKVKLSGNRPRSLWQRIVQGFQRMRSEEIQTQNKRGIRAYFGELKNTHQELYKRAEEFFEDRWNAGQPITLRAVRELALQQFCSIECVYEKIMPQQRELDHLKGDTQATIDLYQKSLKALMLIEMHLDEKKYKDPAVQYHRDTHTYYAYMNVREAIQKCHDKLGELGFSKSSAEEASNFNPLDKQISVVSSDTKSIESDSVTIDLSTLVLRLDAIVSSMQHWKNRYSECTKKCFQMVEDARRNPSRAKAALMDGAMRELDEISGRWEENDKNLSKIFQDEQDREYLCSDAEKESWALYKQVIENRHCLTLKALKIHPSEEISEMSLEEGKKLKELDNQVIAQGDQSPLYRLIYNTVPYEYRFGYALGFRQDLKERYYKASSLCHECTTVVTTATAESDHSESKKSPTLAHSIPWLPKNEDISNWGSVKLPSYVSDALAKSQLLRTDYATQLKKIYLIIGKTIALREKYWITRYQIEEGINVILDKNSIRKDEIDSLQEKLSQLEEIQKLLASEEKELDVLMREHQLKKFYDDAKVLQEGFVNIDDETHNYIIEALEIVHDSVNHQTYIPSGNQNSFRKAAEIMHRLKKYPTFIQDELQFPDCLQIIEKIPSPSNKHFFIKEMKSKLDIAQGRLAQP